jgi:hypothetical protein
LQLFSSSVCRSAPAAFPQGDDLVGGHSFERFRLTVRPLYDHPIDLRTGTESDVDPSVACREIAAVSAGPTPQGRLAGAENANPGTAYGTLAIRTSKIELDPVAVVRRRRSWHARLIEEHCRRTVVGRDNHIDVAVVVEIAKRDATPHQETIEKRPRVATHVTEASGNFVV